MKALFLAIVTGMAAAGAHDGDTPLRVWEAAKPRPPIPGAPRYSDVTMRSLRPHSSKPGDLYDILQAAREFHISRLEWIYLLDRDFVEMANALGVAVGGALEDAMSDLSPSQSKGYVLLRRWKAEEASMVPRGPLGGVRERAGVFRGHAGFRQTERGCRRRVHAAGIPELQPWGIVIVKH
jgi:hypothetical protein